MTDWTHRLRLRHLQWLLSVAETRNLSQSAAALNTTQPALSKWLKELQEDIGLPLFERHARGLRPTAYGEALIEHAKRIEAHLDSARDDMAALIDGGSGLVSIGTSGVSAADTVPLAVARLLRQMPRAQVRLIESTMNLMMPQLVRGELDVVVGRAASETDDPRLRSETLYREPINFVSGIVHPLAGRDALDWDDLSGYGWIVWPQGTPVRKALDTALAAAGRTMPRHSVESNSSILNITLLNHSELVGVASHRAALRFERQGVLRVLPMQLTGHGAVSMYWRDDSLSRAAVAAALDHLRACAREGLDAADDLDADAAG
ncbi:LysR substrate-binding domain-containing protein [Paraburkholderia caballeronis]|uniref:LysR substrate-binding domain-containing protein n=1 Tax=Paraburkholderia caballeronis TaxID=416943 RepID=UPI001065D4D4|nr:LysR substrate-binding domain-containing protein [Paraburkholderia caballeronis]TDV18565.1 LysR family transcriptional regulator [Paraburkholderia caballeronis]TDV19897.1 LysR family transcriptional regulator [Paraburkholderia caballeronis]TDV28114.1 LysR family transcriptional regulator [Paraburkholderia caballeronis]